MAEKFSYDLIPAGAVVLCALSGGADSMYLLSRLLEGAEQGGYQVRAAHYNHHLRPSASRDECFVRDWCARQGVPLVVGGGQVAEEARCRGAGLEETARIMRYQFLRETARRAGCTLIATGHHAGDNAETMLMNLIRGCGLKGLGGIPPQRGELIRPMLAITREEILEHLDRQGVPHVEDETNDDPAYTRNRVRREVLPVLQALNPQAVAHMSAAAARLRRDEEALCQAAEQLVRPARREGEMWAIPAQTLAQVPGPVALRGAAILAARAGGTPRSIHLEQVVELARGGRPSGRLALPGCTVGRSCGTLTFSPGGERRPPAPLALTPGVHLWGGWCIRCCPGICPPRPQPGSGMWLCAGNYVVRPRQTGDVIRLPGRPAKTLKKLMIERRIPACQRDCLPVIAGEQGVAAAVGIGPHQGALARPGEPAVEITIEKENEYHA